MKSSVSAFLSLVGLIFALVIISYLDNYVGTYDDREAMRTFAYHARTENGRKILFNSHTLNTEITPNARNRVESYSIRGFTQMTQNLFKPSSLDGSARIYLVQFKPESPLTTQLKESFTAATGIELGPYMPHNAYAVVCTQTSIEKAISFPDVAWAGDFPLEAKINGPLLDYRLGDIKSFPESAGLSSGISLDVRLAPVARTPEQLRAVIARWEAGLVEEISGVTVAAMTNIKNDRIHIKRDGKSNEDDVEKVVDYLVRQPEVFGVQLALRKHGHNQYAQWITQSNTPGSIVVPANSQYPGRTIWQRNIRGDNQIIGTADSGLDYDHCFFKTVGMTPNSVVNLSMRKVLAYQSLADYEDDIDGHGTHVCGTVLGSVNPSDGYPAVLNQHSGLAPNARLLFSDIETTGSDHFDGLDGVDFPSAVLSWAYSNGARIHTNSWGTTDNSYDSDAASLDDFLYEHADLTVLVAAGNSGGTAGVSSNTVGSPSTAKNVICVAAGNTATAGMVDSLNFIDWNAKQNSARSQLSDPTLICCSSLRSDVQNYCCESSRRANIIAAAADTYNQNNLAYFSSRGPTKDGRFKPDVVGIGQSIVSSRSDGCNSAGCPDLCAVPYNNKTVLEAKDGTSMATPGVAGSVALIRQYLTEGWYPSGTKAGGSDIISTPSGALLGAMIMNSGRSLTGQVDFDNTQSSYVDLSNGVYPLSTFQGFGRIELDNVLYFASPASTFQLYIADDIPIYTGTDYDLSVVANGYGLVRVNMGYRDPAGSASAAYVTVNDVDLYVGVNYLNGSNAWAGNFKTLRDSRNNNEGVQYPVSTGDIIYIKIRGQNIPIAPQLVALVITGPIVQSSVSILPSGEFSVGTPAEYNPASDDSSSSSGKSTNVVIGVVVACVILGILTLIWYAWWYVPSNRRRAAAAKARYDAQHPNQVTTVQSQPVMMGVPMQGYPAPVYGQPAVYAQQPTYVQQPQPMYTNVQQQQPMYTDEGGIG